MRADDGRVFGPGRAQERNTASLSEKVIEEIQSELIDTFALRAYIDDSNMTTPPLSV
jgi:hypothetical protein